MEEDSRSSASAEHPGTPADGSRSRSRRSLLIAGLGSLGLAAAQTLGRAAPAAAAGAVQLGSGNTETNATVIKNTANGAGAALVGQMTGATPGPASAGVLGTNGGGSGTSGVHGRNTGAGSGVFGNTTNVAGVGVLGSAPNSISNALGAIGAKGTGTIGVLGSGEYMGVQGNSPNYAIFGVTTPDTGGIGVYGRGANGVKGRSYAGFAVLGDTDSGTGVKGESYANGGSVAAIHGEGFGTGNNGVIGESNNGTSAYGVWGKSSSGYAGVFSGKVLVTGNLSKGGGSFQIDHPLDPENRYLFHSFVESPDMMNVYNGNAVTNARGLAVVRMPRYFSTLNRDFRYQLTVIGRMAQAIVERELAGNSFTIRTSEPNVKVSWQVTGIRKDPYANQNRIRVEVNKPRDERGTYLHPSAWGKPASRGFQAQRMSGAANGRQSRHEDPSRKPR